MEDKREYPVITTVGGIPIILGDNITEDDIMPIIHIVNDAMMKAAMCQN